MHTVFCPSGRPYFQNKSNSGKSRLSETNLIQTTGEPSMIRILSLLGFHFLVVHTQPPDSERAKGMSCVRCAPSPPPHVCLVPAWHTVGRVYVGRVMGDPAAEDTRGTHVCSGKKSRKPSTQTISPCFSSEKDGWVSLALALARAPTRSRAQSALSPQPSGRPGDGCCVRSRARELGYPPGFIPLGWSYNLCVVQPPCWWVGVPLSFFFRARSDQRCARMHAFVLFPCAVPLGTPASLCLCAAASPWRSFHPAVCFCLLPASLSFLSFIERGSSRVGQ